MSYREITVCLEREDSVQSLAIVANQVGAGLHAYVNGVHSVPSVEIHGSVRPYIPKMLEAQIQQQANDTASMIKSKFEKVMSQGDTNWQWIQSESSHYSDYKTYMDYALHSDLVITTQPVIGRSDAALQRDLLLKVGTPVVIIPAEYKPSNFGNRVAVAWNATAESARAVRDAMPLLVNADEVQIVSVGSADNDDAQKDSSDPTIDQYLAHHGVSLTHHELTGSRLNVSVNLLDHAKNNDIDLIVMGGFGHSKLYDVVVGAATGEVIKNMHIPIFLSH